MNNPLLKLAQRIGYSFQDESLAMLALTHRSKGTNNNERLEFLGDAVLSVVISESLYARFPEAKEGKLSRLRASIVKGETLTKVAQQLQLGDFLLLGSGELKSGGHKRDSILADSVEALIGAIYLEAGLEVTRARILAWFDTYLAKLSLTDSIKDPKSQLQERQQASGSRLPKYTVVSVSGPGNEQEFVVSCHIPELPEPLQASGSSRRYAEQAAAALVLDALQQEASR